MTEMKFRLNAQLELLDIEQEEMLDTLELLEKEEETLLKAFRALGIELDDEF